MASMACCFATLLACCVWRNQRRRRFEHQTRPVEVTPKKRISTIGTQTEDQNVIVFKPERSVCFCVDLALTSSSIPAKKPSMFDMLISELREFHRRRNIWQGSDGTMREMYEPEGLNDDQLEDSGSNSSQAGEYIEIDVVSPDASPSRNASTV